MADMMITKRFPPRRGTEVRPVMVELSADERFAPLTLFHKERVKLRKDISGTERATGPSSAPVGFA